VRPHDAFKRNLKNFHNLSIFFFLQAIKLGHLIFQKKIRVLKLARSNHLTILHQDHQAFVLQAINRRNQMIQPFIDHLTIHLTILDQGHQAFVLQAINRKNQMIQPFIDHLTIYLKILDQLL
jgi:hypothetical protein